MYTDLSCAKADSGAHRAGKGLILKEPPFQGRFISNVRRMAHEQRLFGNPKKNKFVYEI